MNVSPDKLHWIQQWVIKADSDLKAVEHLLTLKDDCPTEIVCFHAQQGVEKYLKALLTLLDIDFPKSHDLGELLKLLPQDKNIPLTIHEAEKLTDYAVSARYPDDAEFIPVLEATEASEIAKRVGAAVRACLPREALI